MKRTRRDIEAKAAETLERCGMSVLPIDPIALAWRLGIQVNHAKFRDENISGLVSRRGDDVQILLNRDRSANRKRFTVAHEIGHYILHMATVGGDTQSVDYDVDLFRTDGDSGTGNRLMEAEANAFAAAILMPEDRVRRYWPRSRSLRHMAELFGVSEEAMAIRISTLGLA